MLSCSIWFSAPSFWIVVGLESRCVGRVCGVDVARQHPHRTHDLLSGSQDHHLFKNSVQKTICCNSTSDAPDDGRYVPETCRAKNTSIKLLCCIKLAFQIIWWGRCTVKQPSSFNIKSWNSESLSWEANIFSASRGIPRILWDQKVHCHVHNSQHLPPIMNHTNLVYSTPSDFF